MSGLANYQRYDNDGIELMINMNTGEVFATAKGYTRMSGAEYDTVKKRCQRGGQLKAEIPTEQGLRWGTLIDEDTMLEWLEKDNPSLYRKFGKLGLRASLHKLAGYEIKSTAIEHNIPKTFGEALMEAGRLALANEKLEAEKLALAGKNAVLESRNNTLKEEVIHLEEVVEHQEPYARLGAGLAHEDENDLTVAEFAKIHTEYGQNTLFEKLREIGFLMQNSRIPYQKHIDTGRAKIVRVRRTFQPWAYDKKTIITPKGQKWLMKKLYETEKQAMLTQPVYKLAEGDF